MPLLPQGLCRRRTLLQFPVPGIEHPPASARAYYGGAKQCQVPLGRRALGLRGPGRRTCPAVIAKSDYRRSATSANWSFLVRGIVSLRRHLFDHEGGATMPHNKQHLSRRSRPPIPRGRPLPLDTARECFTTLVTGPKPLSLDCSAFVGLPNRRVPLDELRRLLMRRACPPHTKDAVWGLLVRRSKTEGAVLDAGVRGYGAARPRPYRWVARGPPPGRSLRRSRRNPVRLSRGAGHG